LSIRHDWPPARLLRVTTNLFLSLKQDERMATAIPPPAARARF
jgi:hypothetical protein